MKNVIIIISIIIGMLIPSPVIAVERAPRISDREIIEGLSDIRGDIKEIRANIQRLEEGQKNLEKRFDDLRSEMNSRFDTIQWMFGLFITITLVILGFVLRMQWQMHRRQTRVETILETHKDDLTFLKGLIEKLLPPKSVL
jgi:chromosome segregation ATPase